MRERWVILKHWLDAWVNEGRAGECGPLSGIVVDPLRDEVLGNNVRGNTADPLQRQATSISRLPGGPGRRATRKPTAE